ncbi:MAG TPA: glycerophosphodiester phosphodiesterase [Thermoprotei archaeon]|nr:glycerophosphodiester phosphodiesterase [Thermoprotei archaeon]
MLEELFKNFFIVGHRGAAGIEPENTLRAIRKALEIGVKAVEIDVRVSKDGFPIVMHDESVDRTTNGSGKISELTLEELRELDAGNGEKIPLLDEVLDEVYGKAVLFLEIKVDEAVEPSVNKVISKGMVDSVLFISFSPQHLVKVKSLCRDAYTGLIYFKPSDGIIQAKKIDAVAVLPYFRFATIKAINFAHRLKLKMIAWTVNDLATAEKLWRNGIDGITTDRPDILIKMVD